jgi:hypothetical protein
MEGLVNGRARAAMPYSERVITCAAEHPQFAFVSRTSLGDLDYRLGVKNWLICATYNFANLRAPDLHYLIASPAAAAEVCAAAGNKPQPLEPVMQSYATAAP